LASRLGVDIAEGRRAEVPGDPAHKVSDILRFGEQSGDGLELREP
jgi:hypothetical protein